MHSLIKQYDIWSLLQNNIKEKKGEGIWMHKVSHELIIIKAK